MYVLGTINLNTLVKIAFSSIRLSSPIWLPIMAANLGQKIVYITFINYLGTTKQTVSDSWLGLYDKWGCQRWECVEYPHPHPSHEVSFAHNLFRSCPIISKNFKNGWTSIMDVMDE